MPITKGILTYDNGRVLREGEDVTEALQETYGKKSKTAFVDFIGKWFGEEAKAEFISKQNEE